MLQAFLNMWRIPELRNKLLFTVSMLAIYRIGFFIPLPAVSQELLREYAEAQSGTAAGNLIAFMGIFTGGSFNQSTLFALGIMPYISAAIIFQLLATVIPTLQQLQKEGPAGRQKIQEYTRYATVGLCVIQATMYLGQLLRNGLVHSQYAEGTGAVLFWVCGILGMTAGTVFLMWLGEQIDKYGIGNGASLIITAGIVAHMPDAIRMVADGFSLSSGDQTKPYHLDTVIFLTAAFIAVVAGEIVITQGQRRIPIQQAKHTLGRRLYGGQRSYLPLRVNQGGVMPIIFASALLMFPSLLFAYMAEAF
ncbi:MAG: preprotein translocase subunit SecY, partial [Phycisphaeraceae bacterium]